MSENQSEISSIFSIVKRRYTFLSFFTVLGFVILSSVAFLARENNQSSDLAITKREFSLNRVAVGLKEVHSDISSNVIQKQVSKDLFYFLIKEDELFKKELIRYEELGETIFSKFSYELLGDVGKESFEKTQIYFLSIGFKQAMPRDSILTYFAGHFANHGTNSSRQLTSKTYLSLKQDFEEFLKLYTILITKLNRAVSHKFDFGRSMRPDTFYFRLRESVGEIPVLEKFYLEEEQKRRRFNVWSKLSLTKVLFLNFFFSLLGGVCFLLLTDEKRNSKEVLG